MIIIIISKNKHTHKKAMCRSHNYRPEKLKIYKYINSLVTIYITDNMLQYCRFRSAEVNVRHLICNVIYLVSGDSCSW